MQNPFSTTFSKIPAYSYIPTDQSAEIIENFSLVDPSESVYKITGVRGSGKTVLLGKIEEEMSDAEFRENGWEIFRLSPSRDLLKQFAAMLVQKGYIKAGLRGKGFNISASVLGTGGGFGFSSEAQDSLFDIGVELDRTLEAAASEGKKFLIGIDEISRTNEMETFTSEFGKWLRAGFPVYLVCTGLYDNIEQLCNVKNLTFFRRATTVRTEPLSFIRMSETYKNKLHIDHATAKQLAEITKGYPYAFQELGVLYFKKKPGDTLDNLVGQLQSELFAYAYEKIWEELSDEDRRMAKILSLKDELKREEVLKKMEKPSNYSVYRDRLLKRGLATTRHSYLSLSLPYFSEYIKEYT